MRVKRRGCRGRWRELLCDWPHDAFARVGRRAAHEGADAGRSEGCYCKTRIRSTGADIPTSRPASGKVGPADVVAEQLSPSSVGVWEDHVRSPDLMSQKSTWMMSNSRMPIKVHSCINADVPSQCCARRTERPGCAHTCGGLTCGAACRANFLPSSAGQQTRHDGRSRLLGFQNPNPCPGRRVSGPARRQTWANACVTEGREDSASVTPRSPAGKGVWGRPGWSRHQIWSERSGIMLVSHAQYPTRALLCYLQNSIALFGI